MGDRIGSTKGLLVDIPCSKSRRAPWLEDYCNSNTKTFLASASALPSEPVKGVWL